MKGTDMEYTKSSMGSRISTNTKAGGKSST